MAKTKVTKRKVVCNKKNAETKTSTECLTSRNSDNSETLPGCSHQTENSVMPPPRTLKRQRSFYDKSSDSDEDDLPPPVRRRYVSHISVKSDPASIEKNLSIRNLSRQMEANAEKKCPQDLESKNEESEILDYSPSSPKNSAELTFDLEKWYVPVIEISDNSGSEDEESQFSDSGSEKSSVIWPDNFSDSSSDWDSSDLDDTSNFEDTDEVQVTKTASVTPSQSYVNLNDVD